MEEEDLDLKSPSARTEGDEDMYMDDEDDDDDEMELPLSLSLSQDSGIASSSPSTSSQEALIDKLMRMRGKSRRKPGRPKKDRPARKSLGIKIKKWKSNVFVREIMKPSTSPSKECKEEVSIVVESQTTTTSTVVEIIKSPAEQEPVSAEDADQGEGAKTDKMSAPDEPPLFQEQWPGKVCGFCNLGERSQLGQGEMLRLMCPSGFTPNKTPESPTTGERGDKSPRGSGQAAVTIRRQKSLSKCRNPSVSGEVLDELSIVGFLEEPEISSIFHPSGHFFTHHSCALWAAGVTRLPDLSLENVGPSMLQASSRRCSLCNHFGASVTCTVATCQRFLHYPCVTASGAFQDCSSLTMVCSQHLDQVPLLLSGDVACITCFALGDVSNLVMCTSCGNHYHGGCVGLALLPGVRSGWQCNDCRLCQICRQPDEVSKIMSCETCDKAYHPHCLRPTVVTIPKYGWKCKCCRVCSDCGSRTPGAGQSSRWHAHYTVCDSCYQQRNKGFSCPLCRRAYRAAAHRGMVQCSVCTKFVHGTCDPEADVTTYNHKKELNPEYEYKCTLCKNQAHAGAKQMRKDSTDESFDSSQEMVFPDDSNSDIQDSSVTEKLEETSMRSIGLGKGKPFCASKIAKKKLGIGGGTTSGGGRPKGSQGKVAGYNKRQKTPDFARKRSSKSKMRGIFGVPGLGLQRPQGDAHNKSEEEPGVENRLVLCSSKDKFVLTQDICVMCGSIGMDQEGCLIPCAQCGQCYHPYCVNVKVTKVILQKGWRCLDCTVCEGCGQRNDEARLILCDDCDISFHIYCMDPPLDYVPHGNWKCKWCATCLSCGTNDPGFNCSWQKSFTECGPCSSHSTCPSCAEPFTEGELVMKCVQCERWLHGSCDQVRTEEDAERCSDEGYNCVLCRPRDVPPPHLLPLPPPPKPPTPTKSPEPPKLHSAAQFYMDGVCLSEIGLHQIKSLTPEQQQRKKRVNNNRKPVIAPPTKADKEAGYLATIESVVSGGSSSAEGRCQEVPMECDEVKEEVFYKEGMVVSPRPDGRPPEPPEGFNIYTTENGVMLLRRKRQRNLQKLGIGGFLVRLRGVRRDKDEEGYEGTPAPPPPPAPVPAEPGPTDDKPRRKPQRRKPKSKLVESYPSYLQEAFFGRDLLDTKDQTKDLESSSDSEDDKTSLLLVTEDKTIQLSQDELKAMEAMKLKEMKENSKGDFKKMNTSSDSIKSPGKDDEESDSEALKDILPGDLLDTDLVNTIMNEDDDITKTDDSELNDTLSMTSGTTHKDELTDILSPHFNLESMVRDTTGLPNMDCKDVEEIFKGVLTDESQESQECVLPLGPPVLQPGSSRPGPVQSSLSSPISLPYHSEYSNSPQFSPAFSEPPSPWLPHTPHSSGGEEGTESTPAPYNQRSTIKMEADEALGQGATISSVLFANMNHPEWKKDHPVWAERCKQILKTWRALSADRKAPYLQKARDNRAALRMKKAQQIPKELPKQRVEVTPATSPLAAAKKVAPSSPVAAVPPPAVPTGGPPEVCHQDQQLTCSPAASSGGVVTNRDTNPPTPPPNRHPQQLTPDSKPQPLTLGPHLIHYPGLNSHATKSKTMHHLQSPSPQQHPVRNPFSSVTNPHSAESTLSSAPLHHSSPNPSPIQHSPSNPSPFQRPSPNPSPIQHQSPLSQTLQHPSPNPSPFQHLSPSSLPLQSSPPNQHPPQTFPPTQHPSPSPSPFPHSIVQHSPSHPPPLPHPFTPVFHQGINPHAVHLPQPASNSMQHPPPISTSIPTPHHLPSNTATIQHLPSNSPLIPPHHQYTVHHYHPFQSGVVTPAPNVVVTRDPIGSIPGSADRSLSSPGSTDQQIRVLTPSEIMRTLPSLGQENYDLPTSTDQDKIMQQQKTCREAEQERQWKQLQALRQQQAQQQQQVIQEQRTQAIARVHRQIVVDDPSITQQLQVSTSQDGSSVGPLSSPSPGSRIPMKVARIQSPGSGNIFNIPSPLQVRPNLTLTLPRGTPTSSVSFSPQSPHDTVAAQFEGDGYTPKPQFVPQSPTRSPIYVPRPMPTPRQAQPTYSGPRQQMDPYTTPGQGVARQSQDPYGSQPATPRPALDSYPSRPQPTRPDSFPGQIVRAQDSFNPRPVQDPFGLQPPTPRPQDPYASQPQTPRPLDPYASQPQTPRPTQEGFPHRGQDPYASQPQTPRPPQSDPFTALGSPSPTASPATRGDAYGGAPQTPRPVDPYASPAQDTFGTQAPGARNVDPYNTQPATPRPDPFATQPPTPRPIDPYASQPQTPRSQEPPRSPAPRPDPFSSTHPNQRVQDPYASQPPTPRPQDLGGRSQEGFASSSPSQPSPSDAVQGGAEVNRQLRDLLQRDQQFKKMDQEAMPPGGRIWNPQQDGQGSGQEVGVHPALQQSQQNQHFDSTVSGKPGSGDTTFRQPLPPAMARPPRIPTPSVGIRGPPRLPTDPRLQSVDPRIRLILQQQQQRAAAAAANAGYPPGHIQQRLAAPRNPLDPYDHLVQREPVPFQQVQGAMSCGFITHRVARPGENPVVRLRCPTPDQGNQAPRNPCTNLATDSQQEIPEHVAAELEKLEQEVEVSSILADLGDDDELLEMGADFNILEYADPELDNIGCDKANILDDLEEPDVKMKHDKAKSAGQQPQQQQQQQQQQSAAGKQSPQIKQEISALPPCSGSATNSVAAIPSIATIHQPGNNPDINRSQLPRISQVDQHQQQLRAAANSREGQGGGAPTVRPSAPSGGVPGARMGLPPPPPPYPGPPPPYPGPGHQQQGLRGIGVGFPLGPPRPPSTNVMMIGSGPQAQHHLQSLQRRPPLLLQEQPLLLEDLLEQEKREQEKQQQHQPEGSALLSDVDFERLRADVLGTNQSTSPVQGIPAQSMLPNPGLPSVLPGVLPSLRAPYPPRGPAVGGVKVEWQEPKLRPPAPSPLETPARVPLFNAPHLPAPPVPPDQILTEQDRQTQLIYEQWLNHQNQVVTSQLKYYETEVQKLRKVRKSLNSKQRQLRKSGNELAEQDALELQRISAEQAILQKQLDASRKQSRQHGMLIQDYRGKQQQKRQQQQQSGGVATPASPQSPLLSPSPSLQHSPLQSPLLHSPNSLGEESPFSPSPGNQELLRSPQGVNPRLPTPPGRLPPGVPFAGQQFVGSRFVRVPGSQDLQRPRAPAMFNPQAVRSGVVYSPQPIMSNVIGQTVGQNQQAQASSPLGGPPGGGQQPQTMQQMQQQLARQQQMAQQLGEQQTAQRQQSDENTSQMLAQRQQQLQMVQQRQMLQQQQQLALQQRQALLQQALQQQQQQIGQSQLGTAVQQLTPQQRQQLMQQQMQKQLQQQQQQQQAASQGGPPRSPMVQSPSPMMQQSVGGQQYGGNQPPSPMFPQPPSSPMPPRSPMVQASPQYTQNQPPSSPMPPKSPMIQQFHNQPPNSPMPPRSPMVQQFNQNQPPNSPMPPRSPMIQQFVQNQPPSSPMPPRSPMVGPNQPPSSPMPPKSPMVPGFNQGQPSNSQFAQNQPPNSPLHPRSPMPPRSPMVQNHALGSPLGARHSVSNSPQSGDNPRTPAGEPSASGDSDQGSRGGGNPHNPLNPVPFIRYENVRSGLRGGGCGYRIHGETGLTYSHNPRNAVAFIRYENVKLGLRGGAPVWSLGGRQEQKPWTGGRKQVDECAGKPGVKVETYESPTTSGDSGAAVDKVASLVAADYNDFEDDNSELTPPNSQAVTDQRDGKIANANTKNRSSNTKHEIQISTELELLAKSENIVVLKHLSEETVAASEGIEKRIHPTADIGLIEDKEMIDQVVEEDEQQVVVMIEENTLRASFSVEQRDGVTSKTVFKQSVAEPVEDMSTTVLEDVDKAVVNNINNLCPPTATACNEGRRNADEDDEINYKQNTNVKCATVPVITAAKSSPTIERKSVGNLKEETQSAMTLSKGSMEMNDHTRNADIVNPQNRLEDKEEEEATVMDLSRTVQDSTKAVSKESHSAVSELETHETERLTALTSAIKTDPSLPLQLVINKTVMDINNKLTEVATPESADHPEVNVKPKPPVGDEAEDLTVSNQLTTTRSNNEERNPNTNFMGNVIVSKGAKDNLVTAITQPNDSPNQSPVSKEEEAPHASKMPRTSVETEASLPALKADTTVKDMITSEQRNIIVCREPTSVDLLDTTVQSSSKNLSSSVDKSTTDCQENGVDYVLLNKTPELRRDSTSFRSLQSTVLTSSQSLPRTILTSSQSLASTVLTSSQSLPRTILTSSQSLASTILTSSQSLPRTILTSSQSLASTILTSSQSLPRTILTSSQSLPRTILTSSQSLTRTVLTSSATSEADSLQSARLPSAKKQELANLVGESVTSTQLPYPFAMSHSCSSLSTVTVSVITSAPRTSLATSKCPAEDAVARTQPRSVPDKSTLALNSTTLNLPPTSTVPVVVPNTSINTLSVISSRETYSSMTINPATKMAHNLQPVKQENSQHSHCSLASTTQRLGSSVSMSLQAIKQEKSEPSNSVLVLNMQPSSSLSLSANQTVTTKLSPSLSNPVERRGNEPPRQDLIQNQSKNSEVNFSVLQRSEQATKRPLCDDSLKFSTCSNRTWQKCDDPRNSSGTIIQAPLQKGSVLESRLMSENNLYQTAVTRPTNCVYSSSLRSDNTSTRQVTGTIAPQPFTSQSKTSTKAVVMPCITTNVITSNRNPSVLSHPTSVASHERRNDLYQQPPMMAPLLTIKEEKVDNNYTPSCSLGQTVKSEVLTQTSCKFSPLSRMEESQNVLLKQLLQNTGCAQTQSSVIVPSLEAQLARPVPPTPSALLPPLLLETGPSSSLQPRNPASRDDGPARLLSPKKETQPGMTEVKKEIVEEPERKLDIKEIQEQTPSGNNSNFVTSDRSKSSGTNSCVFCSCEGFPMNTNAPCCIHILLWQFLTFGRNVSDTPEVSTS